VKFTERFTGTEIHRTDQPPDPPAKNDSKKQFPVNRDSRGLKGLNLRHLLMRKEKKARHFSRILLANTLEKYSEMDNGEKWNRDGVQREETKRGESLIRNTDLISRSTRGHAADMRIGFPRGLSPCSESLKRRGPQVCDLCKPRRGLFLNPFSDVPTALQPLQLRLPLRRSVPLRRSGERAEKEQRRRE